MKKITLVFIGLIGSQLLMGQKYQRFIENGKFGFIDLNTQRITLPAQFVFAGSFKDGIAVAAIGNHQLSAKYGFINEKGKWIITPQYNAADDFSEHKARAQQNGKWGYINKKGEWIIQPQFMLCYNFVEGLAQASLKNNLWGLIDSSGKFILQPLYYNITSVFAGTVCTQKNMTDKWEILNVKNNQSIKTSFTRMNGFKDSLSAARDTSNKWGFVDTRGQWIIPPTYTNAGSFNEGLAAVEKDYTSWGFINKKGEWVIQPRFDRSGIFQNGFAMMEKGTEIVYIDKEGNIVFSFKR